MVLSETNSGAGQRNADAVSRYARNSRSVRCAVWTKFGEAGRHTQRGELIANYLDARYRSFRVAAVFEKCSGHDFTPGLLDRDEAPR